MTTKKLELDSNPVYAFKLSQNSNYEFNFVLLTPENKFLHTPVMCKDYFQDILWCEHTGGEGSIYGLNWKSGMLDINKNKFKMAILGGQVKMEEHIKSLKSFINKFEDALGFSHTSIKKTTKDTDIVLTFSKEWTSAPPMISAFTTLIRLGALYGGGDIIEYLTGLKTIKYFPYMNVEIERLAFTLPKLKSLLAGNPFKFEYKELSGMHYAHGMGIVGFKSFVKVEE